MENTGSIGYSNINNNIVDFENILKKVVDKNNNQINKKLGTKHLDMLFKVEGRHQLISNFHSIIKELTEIDYKKNKAF